MSKKIQVGIIGFGNMGKAIACRLNPAKYQVYIFDNDKSKVQPNNQLKAANSISDLVSNSEVVIIAVKPQDFGAVLTELRNSRNVNQKTLISIAAGVSTSAIEQALNPLEVKVVRAMPNLFAKDGRGISAIAKGLLATDRELSIARELFESLGEARVVVEDQIDAVTAVSGTGPGCLAYFIEGIDDLSKQKAQIEGKRSEYIKAAVNSGLTDAADYANNTLNAFIKHLEEHRDESPEEFRKKVTSKGGTTEAAVEVLESGGSLLEAIKAAKDKAKELTKHINF
jgi:pyrroline-5-carboxylate reductase